jgi:hypothetical protein
MTYDMTEKQQPASGSSDQDLEPDPTRRRDIDLRNLHWQNQWQFVTNQYQRISDGLTKAVNSALLLNGGTAAALLGFMGAALKDETELPISQRHILFALVSFAIGLLMAVLSFWYTYRMNAEYGLSESSKTIKDTWQFAEDTPASISHQKKSNFYLRVSYWCFRISILAYALGLAVIAVFLIIPSG